MKTSDTINVLLADDHQIILDGLQALIDNIEDIHVVAQVNNGQQVINFLRQHKNEVDIVVLDIEMPQADGVQVAQTIKKQYPDIKILILSMYDTEGFVTQMIQIGVSGYILKERGSDELELAIRKIHRGEEYFSQSVTKILVDSIRAGNSVSNPKKLKLTKREIEVLRLIGQGRTTPKIAEVLFIAPSTVDTHRRNLIDKLGVANSRELIRYAVENGYTR